MTWKKIIIAQFVSHPQAGIIIVHEGQDFRLVSAEPYRKADGEESSILTWRGKCLDCTAEFEFVSGRQVRLTRQRCDAHKAKPFHKAAAGGPS